MATDFTKTTEYVDKDMSYDTAKAMYDSLYKQQRATAEAAGKTFTGTAPIAGNPTEAAIIQKVQSYVPPKTETKPPTQVYNAPTQQPQTTDQTGTTKAEPYQTAEGKIDPNYTPKDEFEVIQIAGDDPYMRDRLMANYYKSKGYDISTEALPSSLDEAEKLFFDKQKKEKSSLEMKLEEQKADAAKELERGKMGAEATFAQGREGTFSRGNVMAKEELEFNLQKNYNRGLRALDEQLQELDSLQAQQQANLISGRAEDVAKLSAEIEQKKQATIKMYEEFAAQDKQKGEDVKAMYKLLEDSGALAGASEEDLQYLADGMPGATPGLIKMLYSAAQDKAVSAKEKDKMETYKTGITTMKTLIDSGVSLSPENILAYSKSTGLPPEILLDFSVAAEQVMKDKSLDTTKKQIEIAKLAEEADRQARGIVNSDLEKFDYIENLRKSGASADEISSAKLALGMSDKDDPLYQADLKLKQAQTEYQESQTAENLAKLKDAELKTKELQGETQSYYVPNASLEGIKSRFENGKLIIDSKKPYQCGAFVNRFWGLGAGGAGGMGNTSKSKTDLVARNGGVFVKDLNVGNFKEKVKPGMAFVSKYGSTDHTGIVTAVYDDGTFDTMEANIGDNNPNTPDPARPKNRSIKDGGLVAFVNPPSSKAKLLGGGKKVEGRDVYTDRLYKITLDPNVRDTESEFYKDFIRLNDEEKEMYFAELEKQKKEKEEKAKSTSALTGLSFAERLAAARAS